MDVNDWATLRAHIDHVVADEGQWVGLFDDEGDFLMRLPVGNLSAQSTLRKSGDLTLAFPTVGRWGQVNRAINRLVSEDVGKVGPDGALVPQKVRQHLIVVCRKGLRNGYLTVSPGAPAHAYKLPETLRIPALSLLDSLAMWPCPSVPSTWEPNFKVWDGDAGGDYDTPREYAPVEFATKADGYTMHGPAEKVIRDTVQDSLDAVNHLMGWDGDPHMVVDYGSPSSDSPRALLSISDKPVLDTIQRTASLAGVNVTVDLWWPGDDPVRVRTNRSGATTLRSWDRPMMVARINQMEEAE